MTLQKENYVFLNNIDFLSEKIKKLNFSNTKIFSMNFKVHQHLEFLSIEHEIGEDVLDQEDLNFIFDKTKSSLKILTLRSVFTNNWIKVSNR